jgi:uncharacterized membrane protein
MANPQDELQSLREQLAQLTARIYRLELMAGTASGVKSETVAPAASVSAAEPSPVGPPLSAQQPGPRSIPKARSTREDVTLEKRIGQYWLNRIGIIAMLAGVAYFLKYAFENNWIGAAGRIAIGILAGIGLVLWSERFRLKGHKPFSYSLKGGGIGVLYLSLGAAFQYYHLIPSEAAFAAMVIVTASTIVMALTQDAEILAAFALIGGFSTPVLLSTGENHEIALFAYVCLLDLAMLILAVYKPWRRLLWGNFVGTVVLYCGWYWDHYTDDQFGVTILFATLLAAIFAAIPLVTPFERSTRFDSPSVTLTVLPMFNAGLYFLAITFLYHWHADELTWYALILAAVYLGLSSIFRRRFTGNDAKVINLLHLAIAIAFITIAIPLKLNGHWITMGWLIESAALLWIGVKTQTRLLQAFGAIALAMGIFRIFAFDNFHMAQTVIFNARFATYLVAIAVLAGLAASEKIFVSQGERALIYAARIGVNVMALVALTLEAADYFYRQTAYFAANAGTAGDYRENALARDFSFSAIWLIYGAVLMTVGFKRQSSLVRWQALVLLIVTIAKVFLYDVSELGGGYRILSFIGLSIVLLGISFVYQRDWLKLSAPAGPTSPEDQP